MIPEPPAKRCANIAAASEYIFRRIIAIDSIEVRGHQKRRSLYAGRKQQPGGPATQPSTVIREIRAPTQKDIGCLSFRPKVPA